MKSLFHKLLDNPTRRRVGLAVLLYGLQLKFKRNSYSHESLQQKILYRSFFDAFFHPPKSAWVTVIVPSEILFSLGLSPIMLESMGGVVGSMGLTESFLKNAEELGIPSSLCTFHRAHLASVLKKLFPKPQCVMAASSLCDGNLRSLQEISEVFDSPFFFLDTPESSSSQSITYIKQQLENIFYQLADQMNVKNPLPRLKETLEIAEETRKWIQKVNELRKNLYLPLKPLGIVWTFPLHTSQLGSLQTLQHFKRLYRDYQTKGKSIPGHKIRFLLLHLLPTYEHPVLELLKKRDGVIVMEETSALSWPPLNPEKPFTSLAEKILHQPMMGDSKRRLQHINRVCDEYAIQGIIHFSHWGCRQSSGSINAWKRYLSRPCLNLETDLVNSQSSSTGQIYTRVEGFLEMLQSQR
ncbi:2-hydroxyacyl-CoA dehydratase [bacterium]|nr:2-hydroxyacyl-CoA dehydratase [bacterium]